MKNQKKQVIKVKRSLFEGMGNDEIKALYNLASIRRLQTDAVLIKEGDTYQSLYVILEGEIRIVRDLGGAAEEIAVLREGDWVGAISSFRKIAHTASAVSNKPTNVMVIDAAALHALSKNTQLFFFKRMNDLALERVREVEAGGKNCLP